MKHIHYLEVRIEPFIYHGGTKTLKIKTRVNGQEYNYQHAFEDDDFEDRFHRLMKYAEGEIRNVIKEQKINDKEV